MMLSGLRQAVRSLRRRPTFTVTAILTIALGIGANTAVYQVVYAVLLRPLPFREPHQLVQLWQATRALPQLQLTVPDFEDWRTQAHSFTQMAAYTFQAMNHITLVGQGEPQVVQATNVTADLFSTMGIQPLLGHAFTAADDREKRSVALISEKLWRTRFAADPHIIGRTARLETELFTVIGVVPTRQVFPAWADVWLPFSWVEPELRTTRKYHPLEVIARLRSGSSPEDADREIRALAARLAAEHPETNGTVRAYAIPLAREITGGVRSALLLVWATVGLVLLMACANLAHMLLARMLDRRQEIAVRVSLGANRARLVRLVFTESLLLALAGGACGALLARIATASLVHLAQGRIPRIEGLQGPAPFFVTAVSLLCALLFALPACGQVLRAQAAQPPSRTVTRPRSPLGSILIAAEIAMAFAVLAGGALLVRSFAALMSEDPGFRAQGVLAVEVPLPSSRYDGQKAAQFLNQQLMPAVRALPGVEDVAATNCAPMSLGTTERSRFATRFGIAGRAFAPGNYPVAQLRWVTPEYFRVLGIPLRRGRWLTQADQDQPRYLINETLARQFFPHADPTMHRLIMGVMDPHQDLITIAGVVADVRDLNLDYPPPPTLYLIGSSPYATLLVRTGGDPERLALPIREAVHRADPEAAVVKAEPVTQYVAESLARRRFAIDLLATFAALAVLLTAVGVYGLLAYSVSTRGRELGIRAALGAAPADLRLMMLREGAALAIPGLAAGFVLSLMSVRLIRSLLYRISPLDPLALGGVALLLAAITIFSVWLPARRAAAIAPSAALHTE
ncbi:MAG TPA: ABC transporter permease [Bryobacteraceae bacterium]|nr:ABC transporter permease [Bryobacteraceae bacterium]